MKRIHNFGSNVIDLESVIDESSVEVSNGRLVLPDKTIIVVHDVDGIKYYAQIESNHENVERAGNGKVSLKLDEKYDLTGRLNVRKPKSNGPTLHVTVQQKSGGGGAHNAAFGQGVFLQGGIKAVNHGETGEKSFGDVYNIKPYLHVRYGDRFIEDSLHQLVNYHPICDCVEDAIGMSVILSIGGRKVSLRSKPVPYDGKHQDCLNEHVREGDTLFINSVKDEEYLQIAYEALQSGKIAKCILAATDSMIARLDHDRLADLIGYSDVFISNVDELSALTGVEITTTRLLIGAMDIVRDMQIRDGEGCKKPHIYITFGDAGAAAMDTSGNVFYQPPVDFQIDHPLQSRVVNTIGCGDAFASTVGTLETADFPTAEILDYANAAGQICSQLSTAVGNGLATPKRISEFKQEYGSKPIMMYDRPQGAFIGGLDINCRF